MINTESGKHPPGTSCGLGSVQALCVLARMGTLVLLPCPGPSSAPPLHCCLSTRSVWLGSPQTFTDPSPFPQQVPKAAACHS